MPEGGDVYSNIRQFLGHFIGRTVVDITQHDEDEFKETGQSYVMLMFDSGDYIKFPIGEAGFHHSGPDEEESTRGGEASGTTPE